MYTQLKIGANLKKDVPNEIIEVLKYMCAMENTMNKFPFEHPHRWRLEHLFIRGSSYFESPWHNLIFNADEGAWTLHASCNIKNYNGELQVFIEWFTPFVGSGFLDEDGTFATIFYEEWEESIKFKI